LVQDNLTTHTPASL